MTKSSSWPRLICMFGGVCADILFALSPVLLPQFRVSLLGLEFSGMFAAVLMANVEVRQTKPSYAISFYFGYVLASIFAGPAISIFIH